MMSNDSKSRVLKSTVKPFHHHQVDFNLCFVAFTPIPATSEYPPHRGIAPVVSFTVTMTLELPPIVHKLSRKFPLYLLLFCYVHFVAIFRSKSPSEC